MDILRSVQILRDQRFKCNTIIVLHTFSVKILAADPDPRLLKVTFFTLFVMKSVMDT
jgi:hypothetical protein